MTDVIVQGNGTIPFGSLTSGDLFVHRQDSRVVWVKVHNGEEGSTHIAAALHSGGSWKIADNEMVRPLKAKRVVVET